MSIKILFDPATLFAVLLSGFSVSAFAIPLSYDEAIDGDIISGAPTFALDSGVNTVTGTVSCITVICDFDKFFATLPAGGVLESVALSLTQGDGGNGSWAGIMEVYDQDYNFLVNDSVSGGGNFFWFLDASVTGLNFTGLNLFPGGMVNDYTLTFNISGASVPAPPLLSLFEVVQ
jgi:hypothetical protein